MTQISLKKGKKEIYERQGQSSKDEVSRLKKKVQALKKKAKIENLCRGPQKVSIQNMSKEMTGFVNIIYFST